ncbi:MAG TPA: hypothetical protein VM621_04075 [Luteibacter sp.]|uniref:hypothetical protein n=1 Tax=Luteibacter sp. TaxID=1886636 RepID=UPI002BDD74C8|nr:hypothetical protein [Luteibacter sp.]HVI54218.1 hypothetical protein [Luteibacter sp.]
MDAQTVKAGMLDPSFGDNGKVTLRSGNAITHAYNMATGDDGYILVALSVPGANISIGSKFGLARLHPDGQIDDTFGVNGYAVYEGRGGTIEIGSSTVLPPAAGTPFEPHLPSTEVAIGARGLQPFLLPDGKILLHCSLGPPLTGAAQEPFLAKFNADGSLDASFGEGGTRYLDIDVANHVLIHATVIPMPDRKITVVARRLRRDGKVDALIVRLLENGQMDASFGEEGTQPVSFPGGRDDNVHHAVLQGQKFVLGGNNASQALVRRFLPSGDIDGPFGTNGTYHLPEEADPAVSRPWLEQLLASGDGGFIGIGTNAIGSGNGSFRDYGFVVGIDANGHPNPGFGDGKPISTPDRLGQSRLTTGAFDQAGNLLVAGSLGGGSARGFLVGRYSPAGIPDESFGDHGFAYIVLGSPKEIARGFALQRSGGILLSGQIIDTTTPWKSAGVVMRVRSAPTAL